MCKSRSLSGCITRSEKIQTSEIPIPNTTSRVSKVERDNYGNEVGTLLAIRVDSVKETLWEEEKDSLRANEGLALETPAFITFLGW